MSRLFNGTATTEYLSIDSTPVTAPPFTIAAWVYTTADANTFQCVVSIVDKDVGDSWLAGMSLGGSFSSQTVRVTTRQSGQPNDANADTTATYALNAWQHIAGVFTATNSRASFLNGGNKGTNTSDRTAAGPDHISIGRFGDSTPTDPMVGRIAEVGLWDAALTDDEVRALASGVSPLHIRPQNLKGYWPLFGNGSPDPDYSGQALHLTHTGTIDPDDHPPTQALFGFDQTWESFVVTSGPTGTIAGSVGAKALVVGIGPQFARPTADVSDGNWTNEVGSQTNLYASLDEAVASDVDFIQSGLLSSNDQATIELGAVDLPVAGSIYVAYRYGKDKADGVRVDLTVELLEGGSTVVQTWTHQNVSSTYQDVVQTVTNTITDWGTPLRVRFTATEVP